MASCSMPFETPAAQDRRQHGEMSARFVARSNELLERQGRGNATGAQRRALPMPGEDEAEGEAEDGSDDADHASVNSFSSAARSIHPSVAGSTVSLSCSDVTIGAGDATNYWDYCHRYIRK